MFKKHFNSKNYLIFVVFLLLIFGGYLVIKPVIAADDCDACMTVDNQTECDATGTCWWDFIGGGSYKCLLLDMYWDASASACLDAPSCSDSDSSNEVYSPGSQTGLDAGLNNVISRDDYCSWNVYGSEPQAWQAECRTHSYSGLDYLYAGPAQPYYCIDVYSEMSCDTEWCYTDVAVCDNNVCQDCSGPGGSCNTDDDCNHITSNLYYNYGAPDDQSHPLRCTEMWCVGGTCSTSPGPPPDSTDPICDGPANYVPPLDTWTNGNVTVTQDCSDAGSGCVQSSYSTTVSSNESGNITIYDNEGNDTDCPYDVTNIDKEIPTGSLTVSADNCHATEDVTIGWDIADTGGSGLDRVEVWYRVNGGGWNEVAGCRDTSVSGDSGSGSCVHNVACGADGNLYEYGLHIFDVAGNPGFEDSIESATVNCPAAAPSNFTQIDAGEDYIEFSWTDNSDNEEQFYIYRMPSWSPWGYNSANDTDYYDVNQMVCGTEYNYLISAYDDVCGESDYLDDYASTADCTGPYFTMVISPDSRTIDCGNNTDYNIVLQAHNGFSNNITLSIDGCPSGSTCDFELNPVPPTSNTKLSITNARYSSTLTVTGDGITHQVSDDVDLNVNDDIPPNVDAMAVNGNTEDFTTTDTSLDITWTVSDAGCSILDQVEVWYREDGGDWEEIVSCRDTSFSTAQGPESGGCTHNVSAGHTYEYGVHVRDSAGNVATETTSVPVIETITVTVTDGGGGGNNAPSADFTYCRISGTDTLRFTNISTDPDLDSLNLYWDFDSTNGVDLPASPDSIVETPAYDYDSGSVVQGGVEKTRLAFLGRWADQGVIAGVSEQLDESETEKITFWQKIGNFFSNIWNNIKDFFKNIFTKQAKAQVSVPSFGDGSDGSIIINSSKNLNTDDISTADGDSTADGFVSAVSDIDNNDVTVANASGFSPGDKVLLINMQGSSSEYANVGAYEFLEIDSINSNEITFTSDVQNTYGENNNSDLSGQLIVLQRVPEYTDVTIQSNGTLTSSAWNGGTYGVLAFYVSGTLDVQSGGEIDLEGLGYRGGLGGGHNSGGKRGEGNRYGYGSETTSNLGNAAGGGEGQAEMYWLSYPPETDYTSAGGGGGGYAASGSDGGRYCCGDVGQGGSAVGDSPLTKIFMGGGGGGGGSDEQTGESGESGGKGGGIIIIYANTLTVSGNIYAGGQDGNEVTYCGDDGDGGGGAGGSILIVSSTATLGSSKIIGTGGSGGNKSGCDYDSPGGNGSTGRIHLMAVSYTGTTNPTLYFTQLEQGDRKVTLYVDDNHGGTDIEEKQLENDFDDIEDCSGGYDLLTVQATNAHTIEVDWEASDPVPVSGYDVYYSTSQIGPWNLVEASVAGTYYSHYDPINIQEDTTYWYYVTTNPDELNNSTASPSCTGGYTSTGQVCPLGDTTPLEPDLVTGLTVDRHCGYLTISWDDMSANAYRLYKCIDQSTDKCLDDNYFTSNDTMIYEGDAITYDDSGIIPINVINPNDDNYYCYKVISQAESGGDWSEIPTEDPICDYSYCYRAPDWTER